VHGACLGDAASACLIMELVPGGNLAERIYNPHKRRMSHLEILQARPHVPNHRQEGHLHVMGGCVGGFSIKHDSRPLVP